VYCLKDEGEAEYQMVVNASNREKVLVWLRQHAGDYDVRIEDATLETAMIAVQGPQAISLVQPLVDCELAGMKYYRCQSANLAGHQALVSRTGYTGEDGCELIVPSEDAEAVWEVVLGAGHFVGAQPAGLGCRDTLRLEAAMPLYGHELSEAINPVQAGLDFAYNLEDRDFIGRDAIARFEKDTSLPRRIGLSLSGKRVPREGCPIEVDGRRVGEVTSGTFSPTLSRPIAMGYVEPAYATEGSELAVDIRGRREPAEVVRLPFYKRPK
jgi:aminomethyltransferase